MRRRMRLRRRGGRWEASMLIPIDAHLHVTLTRVESSPRAAIAGVQGLAYCMGNEHPLEGPCDPTLDAVLHVDTVPGKHLGALHMPLGMGNGAITISSLGSPWGALKRLAKIAKAVATNPAVASLLPPQVNLAIATARKVAQLTRPQLQALTRHPDATPQQKAIASAMLQAPPPAPVPAMADENATEVRDHRETGGDEAPEEVEGVAPEADQQAAPDEHEEYEEHEVEEYEQPIPSSMEEHYALHIWGEAAFAPGSWTHGDEA